MAKILNVSINVDKITKSKLIKGKKGTYLSLNIAVNDEKDQFENDCSVWENQSKEERDSKALKNYLGNGKVIWSNEEQVLSSAAPSAKNAQATSRNLMTSDDLPF